MPVRSFSRMMYFFVFGQCGYHHEKFACGTANQAIDENVVKKIAGLGAALD